MGFQKNGAILSKEVCKMKCPRCGFENPSGETYCLDCGFKLEMVAQYPQPASYQEGKIQAKLVFEDGREFQLSDETTIGRSNENDVQIDNPYVSRRHAIIYRKGDTFVIRDVGTNGKGSTNGTIINNSPPFKNETRPLVNGDEITLGEVKLKFVLE